GELGHELHVAGDLEVGDLAPAEAAHVVLGQAGALPRLDPGHDLFAVTLVGHADDLDIGDVGVGVEELLDLAGIHVLAAPDDHVLDAPDDVDVALGIHGGEVARVHPPVLVDGLSRAFGIVPVADHHRVAAGEQLARLTPGHRAARLRRDDLDLDVRVDPADGADPAIELIVGPRLGGDRRRLRHPVTDGHLVHVHGRDDLLHDLDGTRGPGHDPGAQRREVGPVEVGVLELGDEHG